MARRRTLGPALQFFCFLFFSRSKEQFWHVDGHWDQPYSFSVFLFLARRRGAFGTSTDIGTMPYSFSVFCFSKEHCWRVDGHWDQPYNFLEMHSSRFLFYICLFAQLFLNVEQMPLSGRNLEQMVLATEILNIPFFKK